MHTYTNTLIYICTYILIRAHKHTYICIRIHTCTCPEYGTKLHLMVRLQSWNFGEFGIKSKFFIIFYT